MADWKLPKEKLKNYPHFDAPISVDLATKLATDPTYVVKHAFLPLIGYRKISRKFSEKKSKRKGEVRKSKPRDIRYASRKDSYIFSYYRYLLSIPYEEELRRKPLSGCVLAYRKICCDDGVTGKCNIHFAKDVFDNIRSLGNCHVVSLDIKKYFDCIDHENIKNLWSNLIGEDRLPKHHYKVFKAVTQYAVVDRLLFFSEIGVFGNKKKLETGEFVKGYLIPRKNLETKLCSSENMRKAFSELKKKKNLKAIEVNYKGYGIPQGIPLSDILANINLMKFDEYFKNLSNALGGFYYRYSDDIIFILPSDHYKSMSIMEEVSVKLREAGPMLEISKEKSSIISFTSCGSHQNFSVLYGEKGRNGIEYLGFRFDGRNIFIKDGTISNLYRKAVYALKRECLSYARRYPDKNAVQLADMFNYHTFYEKFLTVEDYYEKGNNKNKWTFWTYAKKSASIFHSDSKKIMNQLRSFHYFIADNMPLYMSQATKTRDKILRDKKFFLNSKPVFAIRR